MTALAYPPYDPGMDRFSGWVYLAVFVLLAAAMACVTDLPPFPVRLHGRRGLRAPVAEEEGPAPRGVGPDPAAAPLPGGDPYAHRFTEAPEWSGPPLPDTVALVRPYMDAVTCQPVTGEVA